MSPPAQDNHPNMSDRLDRRSTAPSPSPSLDQQPSTFRKSTAPSPSPSSPSWQQQPPSSSPVAAKAPLPFLSFSTKPDPRLQKGEEEDNVQESAEHSEDENLLDVPGHAGTLKKKRGERVHGPGSAADSNHPMSGGGNRYLRLTPDFAVEMEESVQQDRGTMAGTALKNVPNTSGTIAASKTGKKEHVQYQGGTMARASGGTPKLPTSADIPHLPNHAGHTPMVARFSSNNSQFGQFLQNAGPVSSLAAPTNFAFAPQTSTPRKSQPICILRADRSDGDTVTNTNPSTVRQQSRHRPTMSDYNMPSTVHGSPRRSVPRPSLTSSTRPVDLHAAPGDSVLHPLTRITKEMKERTSEDSVREPKGRPSDMTRGLLQSVGIPTSSDPFQQRQAIQRAEPRAASAGPSQLLHRPTTAGPYRPMSALSAPGLPAGVGPRHPVDPNNPNNQIFVICHFRLENSHVLLGTGVLALSLDHAGDVPWPSLVKELNGQLALSKNWFGLRDMAQNLTQPIPATATTPEIQQDLELHHVAVRFDHGVGMDQEAEPNDMPVSDTPELTRAFRLMARRGWRDVLVAFYSLGTYDPMTDRKGKGKRVRGYEDDDDESERGDKRPKLSSGVDIIWY